MLWKSKYHLVQFLFLIYINVCGSVCTCASRLVMKNVSYFELWQKSAFRVYQAR